MKNVFKTKGYKTFMSYMYGWGAAIVIMGALFKIIHLPGAGIVLMVGMTTEALIFFFSVFETDSEEGKLQQNEGVNYFIDEVQKKKIDEGVNNFIESMTKLQQFASSIYEMNDYKESLLAVNGSLNIFNSKIIDSTEKVSKNIESFEDNMSLFNNNISDNIGCFSNLNNHTKEIEHSMNNYKNDYINNMSDFVNNIVVMNKMYDSNVNQFKNYNTKLVDTNNCLDDIMVNVKETLDSTAIFKSDADSVVREFKRSKSIYGRILNKLNKTRV